EDRCVFRLSDLAESAAGLDSNHGVLDIVGGFDDLLPSTTVAQISEASYDDRANGDRLLGLPKLGDHDSNRFILLSLVVVGRGNPQLGISDVANVGGGGVQN